MFRALKEAIFKETRKILANILRFTIETGLLTTAVIVVQMVLMSILNGRQGDPANVSGARTGERWRYAL